MPVVIARKSLFVTTKYYLFVFQYCRALLFIKCDSENGSRSLPVIARSSVGVCQGLKREREDDSRERERERVCV